MNDVTRRFIETYKEMGLTGYRMGKNCPSITKQKISNIENNLTEASIDMVSNFCEIYSNVNANYILTGKGPMFIEDEDSGSSPKRITARDYRNVTPFFLLSAYYVIINDLYEQTRFYICFILVHYISLYFMKCATNVIPLCDTKSFKL